MNNPKDDQEFKVGNRGKRFQSPQVLQKWIDKYYKECDNRVIQVYDKTTQTIKRVSKPVPYTIEGLCDILDCDRHTLLNYSKREGYEDYFTTIKKAKLKVQRNKVERALNNESNPAVSIFDLKNNHNYKDKQEVEQTNLDIDLSKVDNNKLKEIKDILDDTI